MERRNDGRSSGCAGRRGQRNIARVRRGLFVDNKRATQLKLQRQGGCVGAGAALLRHDSKGKQRRQRAVKIDRR